MSDPDQPTDKKSFSSSIFFGLAVAGLASFIIPAMTLTGHEASVNDIPLSKTVVLVALLPVMAFWIVCLVAVFKRTYRRSQSKFFFRLYLLGFVGLVVNFPLAMIEMGLTDSIGFIALGVVILAPLAWLYYVLLKAQIQEYL